jgi:hypothetical protein
MPNEAIILPAKKFATIGSSYYVSGYNFSDFTLTYTPTNLSSGNIIGSADTISLVNSVGTLVDSHSWTTGLAAGESYLRKVSPNDPMGYQDTDQANDWFMQAIPFPPEQQTYRTFITVDLCVNIDGYQEEIPIGMELSPEGFCIEPSVSTVSPLIITEILPNVEGSDTGKEFIELYNTTDQVIDLANYALWYGPQLDQVASFPAGVIIQPRSYISFTNSEMNFSLLNSSSSVQLTTVAGTVIDSPPAYENPKDGIAWALVEGQWQYTDQPSPGAVNIASKSVASKINDDLKVPQPCAENQYRSPETNRCRLIATNSSTPTPCKDNQYRSEETGRCRNIATATAPTPCKEGQERNPDTNRCRNITKMTQADYGVLGAQTVDDNKWYLWAGIGAVLLLALAYSIWEWRYELGKLFWKFRQFVRIRK